MKTKTKTTYTPGPWVFGKFTGGPRVEIVDPISGHPIAEVINHNPTTMEPEEQYYSGHPHYHGGRNASPNARLIAAAPDLLSGCIAALAVLEQTEEATSLINHLRAAIAKALGL